MNCTLSPCHSEIAVNESDAMWLDSAPRSSSAAIPLLDVRYDTLPMPALRPSFQQDHEEEIYTAFEAALSERLQAVSRHLKHSRDTLSLEVACFDDSIRDLPDTDKLQSEYVQMSDYVASPLQANEVANIPCSPAQRAFHHSTWQPRLVLLFGLMCTMIGFDVMGLLILHLR